MFKTGTGLVILGFLIGDGLALLALAVLMFRHRHRNRSFVFLCLMFLSQALFLLFWISAASGIPTSCRSDEYRRVIAMGLVCLALGVWPTYMHLIHGYWINGHQSLIKPEDED